LLNNTLKKKKR